MIKNRICSIEWCWWKYYAKWLCKIHYNKTKKKYLSNKVCSVEWCNNICVAKLYCWKHYQRLKINGSLIQTSRHHRDAIIEWDIAKIPLWINAKDWYAIVDSDNEKVIKLNWHITAQWYAANWQVWRMHSYIMWDFQKGLVTDHINWNKLDNRRDNLRKVSYGVNMINTRNRDSMYWRWIYKSKWKYVVEISDNNKRHVVRPFDTIEEARICRDKLEEFYWHKIIREKYIEAFTL